MNKKKGIVIGVLALMVTMMVGYAIFSETITINGTATAKGDFNYEITTSKGIMEEINTDDITTINTMRRLKNTQSGTSKYPLYYDENGLKNSSITNTSNTITYGAELEYPGAIGYFTAKITNTGSIPITFDFWDEVEKETTITGDLLMNDKSRVNIDDIMKFVSGEIPENPYGLDGTDNSNIDFIKANFVKLESAFIPKSSHDVFVNELTTNKSAFPKIETGESIYLVFKVSWEDIDLKESIIGLDINGTSKIILPVKQYIN